MEREAAPPPVLYWLLGSAAVVAVGLLVSCEIFALAVFVAGSALGFYIGKHIGIRDGVRLCVEQFKAEP